MSSNGTKQAGLKVVYAFAREMHPKTTDIHIQYGTAGFRTKANLLEHVVYRMGLLAVLRSRVKNGRTVGLMITASHNLEPDNGVKLIDPEGEMLEQSWEEIATRLANVSDNELESTTEQVVKEVNADMALKASVYIGMDTRYTSPRLAAAAVHGVMALKGTAKEFGIVTTPMLHFFVKCRNDNTYGTPTEEGYIEKIIGAYRTLRQKISPRGNYTNTLYVDGANGVGGKKLNIMKKSLDGELDLVIFNTGGNGGKLNLNCGADHVKVSQTVSVGVEHVPWQRVASLDGDSDRVVYYYLDDKNEMFLLDGDRIATLLAGYIMRLVRESGAKDLRLGLVQTAYANGGSTHYITEELRVPVSCVKTGVKHLHHAAQNYDVGVYFEANGHGTVLYSRRAKQVLSSIAEHGETEEQRNAAQLLLCLIELTNETVGDAISDLLLVESVLCANGWSAKDWMQTYRDLPCRQLKLTVQVRQLLFCLIHLTNETVGDAISDLLLVESVLCANGWSTKDWMQTYRDLACRQLKLTVQVRQLLFCLIHLTNETVGDAISDLLLVESVLCANGWSAKDWLQTYRDLPCRQLKLTVQVRQLLFCLIHLTNETVGDAISDLLLVESVLCANGWSAKDWMQTYRDLPCRQLKLTVQDRNAIQTRDAERLCTAPEGLQQRINELCAEVTHGRAFVRPSGTEDAVRVYAEAETQQTADKLAAQVAVAVHELAGGVGDRPTVPE